MDVEQTQSTNGAAGPSGLAGAWTTLAELLSSCSHAMRDAVASRSQCVSLSEPQFALLWACGNCAAGLSQCELAVRLAVSPAHISGLVEQLSNRGLIAGERAAHDRRRQIWRLTSDGRATVERIVIDLEPWSAQLDKCLLAGTRQQLEGALHELAAGLDRAASVRPTLDEPPDPTIALPAASCAMLDSTLNAGGVS